MIYLVYKACSKADLVSVGGIAVCGARYDLSLGKLSGKCLGNGLCGICSTGNAHCLIYIASARKGIADRAAEAGRGTAEGLDLRGMVMSLVFKENEPLLGHAVGFNGNDDRAGVDLVGNLHIIKLSGGSEFFHAKDRKIHKGNEFVLPSRIEYAPGL